MKREVIAHKDPKSPISEIFRTLRTNIQFMSSSKRMKTLLVTSTFPGEGKSWVTSNLAVTFAQAGKRVILIDADMRKGRQYSIFGVSPRPGLSNLLVEYDVDKNDTKQILDYVQETEVENLFLISAGNVPPNPSELLVSKEMPMVLQELRNMCDIVIIDGTPCELVTDSVILSRMVDLTLVVTAHKKTKKDALQRVVKNIKNVGGNLGGVVINKVPNSTRKYEDRYYYYGHDHGEQNKRINANMKERFLDKEEANHEDEESNTDIDLDSDTNDNNVNNEDFYENSMNLPKALQNKNESTFESAIRNSYSSISKTTDILNQINAYLENEKNS